MVRKSGNHIFIGFQTVYISLIPYCNIYTLFSYFGLKNCYESRGSKSLQVKTKFVSRKSQYSETSFAQNQSTPVWEEGIFWSNLKVFSTREISYPLTEKLKVSNARRKIVSQVVRVRVNPLQSPSLRFPTDNLPLLRLLEKMRGGSTDIIKNHGV